MDVGGGINYTKAFLSKATGYTALAGDRVVMDNTTAAATLVLPLAPLDGQWVDVSGAVLYSLFPVYVEGTSRSIMVAADKNCELDGNNTAYRFWWVEAESLWKIRIIEQLGVVS